MYVNEARFWWAIVCLAAAYGLPLALWVKRRPAFAVELFAVPALTVGSWWIVDALELRSDVGFTFYGALPAAVGSNVFVLILFRIQNLRSQRVFWNALLLGGSLVVGVALQLLLPAIAE